MTKTFANFAELTSDLAFDLIDRLASDERVSATFGASNQSCSRYVAVEVLDADGDYVGEGFKVRFSDHADRHGSDLTIRINDLIETITDADGDYVETTISDDDYSDALDRAQLAVVAFAATELEA